MKTVQLFLTAAFLLLCNTANAQYEQVLRSISQQTNNRLNNSNYNSAGTYVPSTSNTPTQNNRMVNSPGVYVPSPSSNNNAGSQGTYVPPPPTTTQSNYSSQSSSQNQRSTQQRTEVVEKCRTCGGSGTCHSCYGRGVRTGYPVTSVVQCASCHGDGKCRWCSGTGRKR